MSNGTLASSFRDPSGFLFKREGILYRQVNASYAPHYDKLMESGLYKELTDSGLLVRHEESDITPEASQVHYKTIKPEIIPFISYPYEWCFSQLKDAALLTLDIQKRALSRGMTLKDASAYNVQFADGRAVLIDTLSFEEYVEGRPWVAYRQFCQHFVAPLALMSKTDVRLSQLMRVFIDGVPLDLARKLLPWRTKLSFGLLVHVHLHGGFKEGRSQESAKKPTGKVSRMGLMGVLSSLESTVRKLSYRPAGTEWADYYSDTNYSEAAADEKAALVSEYVTAVRPETVWDLGANTGAYSRIPCVLGARTMAFDVDAAAVEKDYLTVVAKKETNLLPLVLDLTNPSGGIGWANRERRGLLERGPADMVMALALIHHMAISNNVPLAKVAEFMRQAGRTLVIEFVPKSDSQVQRLLSTREDIFDEYDREHFEEAFSKVFDIERCERVGDSERVLYLMRGRDARA